MVEKQGGVSIYLKTKYQNKQEQVYLVCFVFAIYIKGANTYNINNN